ncbi:MAG: hypothetical protein FJW30_23445 [Acidobacteria bacterium]|nr:hypothetical protein [Acidobacteriota bacterium]
MHRQLVALLYAAALCAETLPTGTARALGVAAGEHRHIRYRLDSGPWIEAETDAEAGTLLWFNAPARAVEVQGAEGLKLLLIDPGVTPRAVTESGIQGRAAWCPPPFVCPANANPARTTPTHLIVHHTATSNISNDWPAVMRAIWQLHVNGNGWADIGYNFLIDPNGVAYEGRGDGILGAHFSAVNTGTSGISMIGTFTDRKPTEAALQTLRDLLAWQASKHTLNPGGNAPHAASGLELPVISGHRDAGLSPRASGRTECPGAALYPLLPRIRREVCQIVDGCRLFVNPVVNSASFDHRPLAPGAIASVFGEALTGLRATVNGRVAAIVGAVDSQINFLVPPATEPGISRLQLLDGAQVRREILFPVTETAPAFYSAAVNHDEGTLNGATAPVKRGRPLTLYVSGAGRPRPWSATLGGNAAGALFLGPAPGFPGVEQCNILVPESIPPGEHALTIAVSGVESNTVSIFVN